MSGPDHPATVEDATDAVSPAAGADGRDAGTAYLVRRPSRGDAEAFAELHAHVWRATYRGLMEDRVVHALSPEGLEPMWEVNNVDKGRAGGRAKKKCPGAAARSRR